MTRLVSAAAYARLRGVSRTAVGKALATGRITAVERDGKRLIDVDQANISWAARTDSAQQNRGSKKDFEATQPLARASAARKKATPATTAPLNTSDHGFGSSLLEEKTRSERLRVEKQEIDLAVLRGQFLSRSSIEKALAEKLIAAREMFEAIPDRLAARIAAERDANVIHQILRDEIFLALTMLSTVRTALPPLPQSPDAIH
jgi:hypothetical protein